MTYEENLCKTTQNMAAHLFPSIDGLIHPKNMELCKQAAILSIRNEKSAVKAVIKQYHKYSTVRRYFDIEKYLQSVGLKDKS